MGTGQQQLTAVAKGVVLPSIEAGSFTVNDNFIRDGIANLGGAIWKAGAYLAHRNTAKTRLAICLEEYHQAGLLQPQTSVDSIVPKWQTTATFLETTTFLNVYGDIAGYLRDQAFDEAELEQLGLTSMVTLCQEKSDVKRLGDITQRLSDFCRRNGIKDYARSDAEKRIKNISFTRMGSMALENAFRAEGLRRERGEKSNVVPVLGRVLGIAMMCGFTEITNDDVVTILGKSPIFETVIRARVGQFRDVHASEVFNHTLFQGSTESVSKGFPELAPKFKGKKIIIGHITASGKQAEFLREYEPFCCTLQSPDTKQEPGKPVYMLEGWANLLKQRQSIEKEHSGFAQMLHFRAPTTAKDIHGNTYMSAGSLGKITFKVKQVSDGTLMAKAAMFERFVFNGTSNVGGAHSGATNASGQEKLFGGVLGPQVCACKGKSDLAKGQVTKQWKLGKGLDIETAEVVGNSIKHTQRMKTGNIHILWRPGDWAMGCFFMQILPQSSYLQGREQCLYCAVEGAALAGCPEVIACGGGKVHTRVPQSESPVYTAGASLPVPEGAVSAIPHAPAMILDVPADQSQVATQFSITSVPEKAVETRSTSLAIHRKLVPAGRSLKDPAVTVVEMVPA